MKVHTPEPWYLDHGQIRDKDGDSLASVPYSLGSQDHANGVLMAAAPELLSALIGLLKETKARCPKLNVRKDFSLMLYMESASRAIAKAEGREA